MRPVKRGRKIVILRGLAAVAVLGAAVWLFTLTPMWRHRSIRFESGAWKAASGAFDDDSIRQRMVDDLLRSKRLVGLSRSEVESLIGPPAVTEYFGGYDMVYLLGQERSSYFAIDSEWLAITLDGAGLVIDARLVTD
ncbi:MAG: hypothetical protein KF745_10510 [Phycisphaeraceae bacterium]|nr:hypothetical protein [Phycisphaeraceae bacterium]